MLCIMYGNIMQHFMNILVMKTSVVGNSDRYSSYSKCNILLESVWGAAFGPGKGLNIVHVILFL